MMQPAICNSNKRSPAVPDECPSAYWLVRVNGLTEVTKISYDHAYMLPDDSVWVWSFDESKLILISEASGVVGSGMPTQIHSIDGNIEVTGSGTHHVGLALSPEVLQQIKTSIDIGQVTTGAPGTNVIVTNSGIDGHAVLNFTIPRGEQGLPGEPGEDGPAGPQGEQGPAGPQGEQGSAGPQGEQGPSGPQGEQGPAGSPGEQGPAGPQGEQGPAGPQGEQGPAGPQGEQGPAGPQGEQGPAGSPGDQGPAGSQGEQGPAGSQGEQGPAGPQGEQGPAGPQGEQGPAGPQGEQGPAGPQGEQGPAGPQGEQGPAGPQGEQGPAGPQGEQGPPGEGGIVATEWMPVAAIMPDFVSSSLRARRVGKTVSVEGFYRLLSTSPNITHGVFQIPTALGVSSTVGIQTPMCTIQAIDILSNPQPETLGQYILALNFSNILTSASARTLSGGVAHFSPNTRFHVNLTFLVD